ncbi:MAG: error-prone DNA polymerase [Betaproteobacteria bacterium]|nr:MAG: error-prone DNA polymerase [Betaproteobacteria bacterium]
MHDYAELHCISNFSFLRGASHPEELVERAAALGYSALAITDECSVAGVVRAHTTAKQSGLKLLVGSEFRLADGLHFALLAQNRNGYGNLCELITRGRRAAKKGEYYLTRNDIAQGIADCLAVWLPNTTMADIAVVEAATFNTEPASWLASCFPDRLWIAVELLARGAERKRLDALCKLGEQLQLPCVAAGDVHMHLRERRMLQDTLTAIRLGKPVSQVGYELHPCGERHLRHRKTLGRIYPPELLAQSIRIAQRCDFSLDSLRYEYPEEIVPPGLTPSQYLRQLTEAGLAWRFPCGITPRVRELIDHELALIEELHYEPYFLTVYDIVKFARGRNILCQGRGSAANSAVCYALGITEVDPSRMAMLFERFISKERNEPPDIDVDFEHERREEVIQYIYEKYGRDRAALAATVITYRAKSAFRDVGKALGLNVEQVNRISKNFAWWDRRSNRAERLKEAGFDPASPVIQRLITLTETLGGFPRHLSQHVGGFVITRSLLSRLVPVENAAMAERSVIQWDKDDLDALGLLKVDVLALGMLSAIRRALALVSELHKKPFAIANVPAEDPEVYAMIQRADTIGVFQIESRAQMSMLPRLRPQCFYDLVIEVAIVRPGPIQGGMVHPYLRRRQGTDRVTYPSEEVRSVLERTLGVPIFQEQVMQLAVVAAGFTPGEADQLRRSMAAWRRRGGLQPFEEKLIRGMRRRGYSEAFARQIFQQILGFGEYGFPESHSASFALLVYVSSWLKRHYPAAFTCALLNSQPMGFYAPSQLVQDARRHGVEIRPVDVFRSDDICTLEQGRHQPQPALRLGFKMVKGLSEAGIQRLVDARRHLRNQPVEQLMRAAKLSRRDMECLAAAGALSTTTGHRHNAAWTVAGIEARPLLLEKAPVHEKPVDLPPPTEGENIIADYASIGLTLGRHPLALLRPELQKLHMLSAEEIRHMPHGRMTRAAGIVTCRQRPGTASGVVFITLEDETGFINVVVWGRSAAKQRRVLLGARLMAVHGHIEREGEVIHLVAGKLIDQSHLLGNLLTRSRDFH